MKRLLPFAPLLLLAALLLSPSAALSGARQGLDIWWSRVFPALLPSFISVKLAQELGLLRAASRHPRGQLVAVVSFSMVSGAPNGAKLLHGLREDGRLSAQEIEGLLPWINSVRPAFLVSIIASVPLKNKALFLPMAVAFYGSILCLAVPRVLRIKSVSFRTNTEEMPFSQAFAAAVENAMLDMLRVGGCIVFACTLLSLLRPLFPGDKAYAAMAGLLEVSTGTALVGELSLPLRLKASLLFGVSAFGGLSLALQTICCYPGLKLVPYLMKKLLLGVLTTLTCFFLFPLFPGVSVVFASRQQVLSRSLTIGVLLLSSALSLAFIGVLSLMMAQRKKA